MKKLLNTSSPKYESMKIATLEYVRFALSLFVVVYHLPLFGIQKVPYVGDSGHFLVLAFMCLSGIVLWHRSNNLNSMKEFIIKRFFRLYPLHLLSLVLMLLVSMRFESPYREADSFHIFLHFTLLHGSGVEEFGTLNAPSWAVSTEFLSSIILAYVFTHKTSARARVALLFLMIIIFQIEVLDPKVSLCCSAILVGSLVYDASGLCNTQSKNRSRILKLAVFIIVLSLVIFRLSASKYTYTTKLAYFLSESYLIDLLIISALFYLLLLTKISIKGSFLIKLGKQLGGGAYGIYLFHVPVLTIVQRGFALEQDSQNNQRLFLVLSCIFLVTLVTLVHKYVEKPAINWCNSKLVAIRDT